MPRFVPPPWRQRRAAVAETLDFHGDFEALLAYALPRGNDLEAPAAQLVPEIRAVLAALVALDGVRLARLSGSGPTCFALFASETRRKRAACAARRRVSRLVDRRRRRLPA